MANYTITNIKEDVEDTAGTRTSSVEGRFARKHLDSRELGISYFRYGPGFRPPAAIAIVSRRRSTWSSRARGA